MKRSFFFAQGASLLHTATALISGGRHREALTTLNTLKKLELNASTPLHGVDYFRAVCMLSLSEDYGLFHARQAVLEELRCDPTNVAAWRLLHQLETAMEESLSGRKTPLSPPREMEEQEPLFYVLSQGLQRHTMLDWKRMFELFRAVRNVCENGVWGDVMECGVAAGGGITLMAVAARQYDRSAHSLLSSAAEETISSTTRRVAWACDCFRGMPLAGAHDRLVRSGVHAEASSWGAGTCVGPASGVQQLARNYNVCVQAVQGHFEATLRGWKRPIAVLHVDADWEASTAVALREIVPQMPKGGIVQVDDYGHWEGCKRAVDTFLESGEKTRAVELRHIDNNAVQLHIG